MINFYLFSTLAAWILAIKYLCTVNDGMRKLGIRSKARGITLKRIIAAGWFMVIMATPILNICLAISARILYDEVMDKVVKARRASND